MNEVLKKRLLYILLILHAIVFFWLIDLHQNKQPIGNRIFILPGIMAITLFYTLIQFPLKGTPYQVTFDRNDPKFNPVIHQTLIHQDVDLRGSYELSKKWLDKISARINIDLPYERIVAYRRDVGGEDSTLKDSAFHIELLFSYQNDNVLIEIVMISPLSMIANERIEPYWSEYIEEYARFIGIDITDRVLHSIYSFSVIREKIFIENKRIAFILFFLFFGVLAYLRGEYLSGAFLIVILGIAAILTLKKRNKFVRLQNRF